MAKTLHSPEQEAFVALLRELRASAGVTQEQLAERLGRPQSFVSKVESGERRIDLVELHRYCAALGLDLVKVVRRYLDAVRR